MNIVELINACGGPDKVGVQYIDQCSDRLEYNSKRGTKITFGSDQTLTPNGTEKFGMVVWMDRDDVRAALALAKGEQA